MSLRKSSCFSAFLLLSVPLLAADFEYPSAGNSSPDQAGSNQPTRLTAKLKSEEMVGGEPVRRAYIDFGTNKFAFVVPPGFRMDAPSSDKVTMVNVDLSCFMVFRVISSQALDPTESQSDTARGLLLKEHPGASITEEFSLTVAGHSGPAFDFQFQNPNGTQQSGRAIFISGPAGVMEFGVLTRRDKIKDSIDSFRWLILQFRSNENGKLEVNPMLDKT